MNLHFELRRARRVVFTLLLALPVVFVAGRVTAPRLTVRDVEAMPVPRALPAGVERFHDASIGVTCWQDAYRGALACLPDRLLSAEAQQP